MRNSFVLFCISVCLLAIDALLRMAAELRGFLGLYPFDYPARALSEILFYLSLLSFCSHAYAVLGKHRWSSAKTDANKQQRPPGELAGVALSSLLSLFFVMAITKQAMHIFNGVLIYCLFLFSSALLMQSSAKGWRASLANAVWPAGSFLLSAMVLLLWNLFFKPQNSNIWQPSVIERQFVMLVIIASACLSLFAVPAIAAIDLSRKAVLNLAARSASATPGIVNPLIRHTSFALAAIALAATAVLTAEAGAT